MKKIEVIMCPRSRFLFAFNLLFFIQKSNQFRIVIEKKKRRNKHSYYMY